MENGSITIKDWVKKKRTHRGKKSKTMNNKKEGGAMEKHELNKTGESSTIKRRGRPRKKRMIENKVDEEVVRKGHVKKKGRPVKIRGAIDNKTSPNGVGEQKNEHLAVANKRLLINQTDKFGQENNKLFLLAEVAVTSNQTDETLPFTKASPLWEVLESSEVLTMMPQKPHFLPLEKHSKIYREGMAIGLMVTFTNMVHTMKSLSISDPDEGGIEQMMDALTGLERHGFDLYKLRDALKSVWKLKEDHKRLTDKMEEFDRGILKLRSDIEELEESFLLAKSSI